MPVVPPIITTNNVPIVSFVAPNVTYNQILESLGSYVYGVEFIYLATTNYTQISQPVKYNHFDANGNAINTYLPFAVDPYQNQPSIYFHTNPDEVILDGFSSLTFDIDPNNIVFFKIFVTAVSTGGYLNTIEPTNFEVLENAEGVKFFDDFCRYLIDEEDVPKA